MVNHTVSPEQQDLRAPIACIIANYADANSCSITCCKEEGYPEAKARGRTTKENKQCISTSDEQDECSDEDNDQLSGDDD